MASGWPRISGFLLISFSVVWRILCRDCYLSRHAVTRNDGNVDDASRLDPTSRRFDSCREAKLSNSMRLQPWNRNEGCLLVFSLCLPERISSFFAGGHFLSAESDATAEEGRCRNLYLSAERYVIPDPYKILLRRHPFRDG